MAHIRKRRRIEAEASEWVARCDAEELSADRRAALDRWLAADARHRAAFNALQGTWARLDALGQLKHGAPERADRNLAAPRHVKPQWRALQKPQAWAMAAAASLLMAVTVASMVLDRGAVHEATYRTDIGEQREVALPDGSLLNLNTGTRIAVVYTAAAREVTLRRGEAHFEVARDTERPFSVLAGTGVVRAVGTAFNVRLKAEAVEVTVTEGAVTVGAREPAAAVRGIQSEPAEIEPVPRIEPLPIAAGQKARLKARRQAEVTAVAPAEIERSLAWRDGMLLFNGETLEEMVAEVNRYSRTRIAIANDELRAIRVGGYFKAGDVDAVLELVTTNLPVKADRVAGTIYLRKTQDS